jgi:hypothetical protein
MLKLCLALALGIVFCACSGGSAGTPTPSIELSPLTTASPKHLPGPGTPGPSPIPTPSPGPLTATFENDLPEGRLLFERGKTGAFYSIAGNSLVQLSQDRDDARTFSSNATYFVTRDSLAASPPAKLSVYDSIGEEVASIPERVYKFAFSPDETALAVQALDKFGLLDVKSNQVRWFQIEGANSLLWSPNSGALLVQTLRPSGAVYISGPKEVVDRNTGEMQEVTGDTATMQAAAFSPNGRYLAFATGAWVGEHQSPWQTSVFDRQTSSTCVMVPPSPYVIKFGGGSPIPHWDHDSQRYVVTDASGSALGGSYTRVDMADVSTCSVQTVATQVVGFNWSPNAERLVLSILPGKGAMFADIGTADVYLWTPDAGLQPLNVKGSNPLWSPDGSKIFIMDGITGGIFRILRVADMSETDLTVEQSVHGLIWSPSGKYFLTTQPRNDGLDVYLFAVKAGVIVRQAEITDPVANSYFSILGWMP